MSKGKKKTPNLWNNFLSSWITEHVNYFQRNKLHNSKNAILSVIVGITCICSVKGIWICSIPVLVPWSLGTPALTEPGPVSHVLGVGSFLSPPEPWVKRTVCCHRISSTTRGLAQTVIEVSIILQVTRAPWLLIHTFQPYFWPAFAFKPPEETWVCISLSTSWPNAA